MSPDCDDCERLPILDYEIDDLIKALDLQNISEFVPWHIILLEEITREWREKH